MTKESGAIKRDLDKLYFVNEFESKSPIRLTWIEHDEQVKIIREVKVRCEKQLLIKNKI